MITIGGPSARLEQRFSATTARTNAVAHLWNQGESARVWRHCVPEWPSADHTGRVCGLSAYSKSPIVIMRLVRSCKDETTHKLGLLCCCTHVLLCKGKNTFQHIKRWQMCT